MNEISVALAKPSGICVKTVATMSKAHQKTCYNHYDRKCACCKSEGGVEVHHIDGHSSNNEPANLIPLCESCHSKVESDCWTDEVDAPIEVDNPLLRWLVKKKRAYSPNSDGSDRDPVVSVGGEAVPKIRKLKGMYQSQNPETEISNQQTVEWAIENELARLNNE